MHRKIILLLCAFLAPFIAVAEVDWILELGGMYKKQYGVSENSFSYDDYGNPILKKEGSYEITAGLYLQIPLSAKIPIFIETGLGYRNKLVISQDKGFKFDPDNYSEHSDSYSSGIYSYRGNFVDLPLKVGYKLPINDSNGFEFGLGPLLSMCTERGYGDPLSVGMTASVVYRHRCLGLGFSYSNPIFLNGIRDYYKNSINFTISIKFGNKAWAGVGKATMIAGSIAGGIAEAYANSDTSTNYQSGISYNSDLVNNSDNSSNSINSSRDYQSDYNKWEAIATRHYNSITQLGISVSDKKDNHKGSTQQSMSPSTYRSMKKSLRDAQKQMAKIRREASKAGIVIVQSKIETATVSY